MNITEEFRLGKEILHCFFTVDGQEVRLNEDYSVLDMPGINAALFMIYQGMLDGRTRPRPMLQLALILGYLINESIRNTDQLWTDDSAEEPDFNSIEPD